MYTQNKDIVADFNWRRALKSWHDRGVPKEELVEILQRDLAHCEQRDLGGSAINIQRMLVALDNRGA